MSRPHQKSNFSSWRWRAEHLLARRDAWVFGRFKNGEVVLVSIYML